MKTNVNLAPSPEQMLFLIRRIIAELSLDPTKTKVKAERIGMTLVGIEIDPNPSDYSKILGKNGGDHLAAMQMICKLVSDRSPIKYELTLKRIPQGVEQSRMPDFQPKTDWRRDHFQALTKDMFGMILPSPSKVAITDGQQEKTAIEVFVGYEVPTGTVAWINRKLVQLYKSMGLKNGRIISFNVIQNDDMSGNGHDDGDIPKRIGPITDGPRRNGRA